MLWRTAQPSAPVAAQGFRLPAAAVAESRWGEGEGRWEELGTFYHSPFD